MRIPKSLITDALDNANGYYTLFPRAAFNALITRMIFQILNYSTKIQQIPEQCLIMLKTYRPLSLPSSELKAVCIHFYLLCDSSKSVLIIRPVPVWHFLDNDPPRTFVVQIDIFLSVDPLAHSVPTCRFHLFQMASCNDVSSFLGVFLVSYYGLDRYC